MAKVKQNILQDIHQITRSVAHRPRLLAGAVIMVAGYFLIPHGYSEATRLLLAWNAGVWVFLALVGHMIAAPTGGARCDAAPEDEAQWVLLALAIFAAAAAIAAILWRLGPVKDMTGWRKAEHLGLVVATLISAWSFTRVMFALHYAGAYYTPAGVGDVARGLNFPNCSAPDWGEFMYQAFVVGCAFATADVNVTTYDMRRIVIAQGVVAFFFNTVILAMTINIGAGFI